MLDGCTTRGGIEVGGLWACPNEIVPVPGGRKAAPQHTAAACAPYFQIWMLLPQGADDNLSPQPPCAGGGVTIAIDNQQFPLRKIPRGPMPTHLPHLHTNHHILVPTARQFENEVWCWCMFQASPLLEPHHMAAMGSRGHARAPPEHAQPPPTPAAESNGF